jgi:hypothetical protein
MAFTFTNYAGIQPQASPFQDILGKTLGGYEQATKAKYLQPGLEEELKKAKLYNQYYGPNMESQIGLRGAQTQQANAHTGLLGEQTKGQRLENQYLPQYKQAQIAQLNAQAQKAQLLQQIRDQFLGGGMMPGQQMGGQLESQMQSQMSPQMQSFQGQGMPNQEQMNQPQMQSAPRQMQGLTYPQQAIISQALGLGMPKVENVNGRYVAIGPLGVSEVGVQGLTEQQKHLAKEDAKKISQLEDTVLSGSQKQETFDKLNTILGSNEFEKIRQNPILGKHEISYYQKFGTPEQQEMIGQAKTHMGNIIKDAANDFKGQFRVGEQALLREMKPDISDTIDEMKGKAEALTYMNQIMTQRAELEADFMRNQAMSPLQARIAANKRINPKAIEKEIKEILHPASSKKMNFSKPDLEYTAKKHGMTIEEVRRKLEGKNA